MNENKPKVIKPEMLILAREARGLTQSELAERLGITQGQVSKIESSILPFQDCDISKLESALGYPESFYYRDWNREVSNFLFRASPKAKASENSQVCARITILKNQIRELVNSLERKNSPLPRMAVEDIEGGPIGIARVVRKILRLPPGPIEKLVKIIEGAGCIVVPFDFMTAKIDACCDRIDGIIPVIFANMNACRSRLRFSIAHELGHLIMHDYTSEEAEKEADLFAAEFLLPDSESRQMLLPLSIQRMVDLKLHWKVSMFAILTSARKRGLLSDYQSNRLHSEYMFRYKYNEPVEEFMPKEEPQLLRKITNIYKDELHYSPSEIGQKISLFEHEVLSTFDGSLMRVVV